MIYEFNPADFRSVYPQFTEEIMPDERMAFFFELCCSFINNTENSPFPYDPDKGQYLRKQLLYLCLCHVLTMALWGDKGQSGPLASASEGSVSVSFQLPQMGKEWFNQTPCGRTLLQLLKPYYLGGRIYITDNFHPYG